MNYNEKYITIPESEINPQARKIHYLEWGNPNNNKILICVHGLTRNAHDFDHLADIMSPYYRILSIDVAGRGMSDWLEDPLRYNYETYVTDLMFIFSSLGLLNDKIVIDYVGTSMGGLIGMTISGNFPKLIRKLVINDVGPHIPISSLKRIGRYTGLVPEFSSVKEVESHLRKILSPFGIINDEHWDYLARHAYYTLPNGTLRLNYDPQIAVLFIKFNEMQGDNDFHNWALWDNITSETMLIRGESSDILTLDTYNKMVKHPKVTKTVEFKNSGHAPALMELEQIYDIRDFLLM